MSFILLLMWAKMFVKWVFLLFILIRCAKSNDYFNATQRKCILFQRPYYCAKYRFLKFVSTLSDADNYLLSNSTNIVKIMKIEKQYNEDDSIVFTSRQENFHSEYDQFFHYLKLKAASFLNKHGIGFTMPEGTEIMEEELVGDEARQDVRAKKKKFFLIPIIILAKLFKIKLLISLVLFSVLVIKKIFLVVALIFPAILTSIKNACKKDEDRYYSYAPETRYDPYSEAARKRYLL